MRKLIVKLFDAPVSTYIEPNALADSLVVSRRELVEYLTTDVGLKVGSKVRQQASVPKWIADSVEYSKACLRGLVDTDGCLIIHKYSVKNKTYKYKKLGFSNSSRPIIDFVWSTLERLGIKSRVAKKGKEVRVDGQTDMKKYFSIIGSNNPKHLRRWLK